MRSFLQRFTSLVLSISLIGALSTLTHLNFQAKALTVSPVKIELSAAAGESLVGSFKLTNEQDKEGDYYVSFANFEAQGETGAPLFTDGNEGLASWMQLLPSELTSVHLNVGETKEISYQVDVPEDASPGGHFAAIFWGTSSETDESQGVALGAKVGILVFLTVEGGIQEKGGFLEFDTLNGENVFNTLPIGFFYRIQNEGVDRIIPEGNLTIKNILGLNSWQSSINKNQNNVLPTSIRRFEESWEDLSLAPVEMSFLEKAEHQWQYFALGYYTAELDVKLGASSEASIATVGFWVLPWQLLIILGVGGGSSLILLFFLLKSYNHWIIANALNRLKSKPTHNKKKRK